MLNRAGPEKRSVGLLFALLLLIGVAISVTFSWTRYVQANHSVDAARSNIQRLERLLASIRTAESTQRGYFLSRNEKFLDSYSAAATLARGDIASLHQAAIQNAPESAGLLDQLAATATQRLDLLKELLDRDRVAPLPPADLINRANRGKLLMEQVLDVGDQSIAVTRRRFDLYSGQAQHYAGLGLVIALLGSAATFVIVLLSTFQIKRLNAARTRLIAGKDRATQEFRVLADSVPQMVWRASSTGELTSVNRQWLRYPSITLTDSSCAWSQLLHDDDRDDFLRRWSETLDRSNQTQPGEMIAECRLRQPNADSYRWHLFQAKPVQSEISGLRWYGTFTDIENQKNTEKSLLRANAELEQFCYIAAHDLQEPARNISLRLDLLIRKYGPRMDPRAVQFIDESAENARRMLVLVNDLLTYATVVNGQRKEEGPVNTEGCLRHALANLEPAIRQVGGANVHWEPLPELKVSRSHLIQLFQNLVGNSIKYRKPKTKPTIQIEAVRQAGEWVWSVADRGIGFDPAYSTRIFKLFKRLNHKHEEPGNGMGLAICERIITFYGGRIWAESKPDKGATFRFTLPA